MSNRHDEIDEGPSEADLERFGSATVVCPKCRAEVYDDTAICWKCGNALAEPQAGMPVWVMFMAMLLVIVLVVFWVFWVF